MFAGLLSTYTAVTMKPKAYAFRGFNADSRSLMFCVRSGSCIDRTPGAVDVFDRTVPARSGDLAALLTPDTRRFPSPDSSASFSMMCKYVLERDGHWFYTTCYSDASGIPDAFSAISAATRLIGTLVATIEYPPGQNHPSFDPEYHHRSDEAARVIMTAGEAPAARRFGKPWLERFAAEGVDSGREMIESETIRCFGGSIYTSMTHDLQVRWPEDAEMPLTIVKFPQPHDLRYRVVPIDLAKLGKGVAAATQSLLSAAPQWPPPLDCEIATAAESAAARKAIRHNLHRSLEHQLQEAASLT